MSELLTDPTFSTWIVRIKAALEDFFSWTSHLHARDQARLEAFGRKLVESEILSWSYKETTLSYPAFCTAASHRRLQESSLCYIGASGSHGG
ncbi:hypothetical protein LIER_31404 [Lithospermum erythrorhizon]|uniref:Uncharacterized protein n=1 Tax=Lithospermum erythrorhizon TaxID=34254 RepID=A0AAV3RT80_LITER